MEKYVKTFKTLDKRLAAFSKIVFALAAIVICFGVVTIFVDLSFISDKADSVLQLGASEITLAKDAMPEGISANLPITISLFLSGIELAFTIVLVKLVREIIRPFANGEGMGNSVSKGMKKLSIFALCYGAIMEVIDFAGTLVIYNVYDIKNLFDSAKVAAYEFSYESEGTFIIIAAVLFILSKVAVYVEELQTQVDETL